MSVPPEIGAAAALTVGRVALVAGRPVHERVAGLAWLPLGGLAVGGIAALAAAAAGVLGAPAAALAGALVLGAARGDARRWTLLAAGAVQVAALAATPPAARTMALVVAPMLARWACVVQCYGGRPAPGAAELAALAGRARFREFAIASVTALGTMLVLLD